MSRELRAPAARPDAPSYGRVAVPQTILGVTRLALPEPLIEIEVTAAVER